MEKIQNLPGSGEVVFYGKTAGLFPLFEFHPLLFPGEMIGEPQTVFLAERSGPAGRKLLNECIERKVPFIIIGKGWGQRIPTDLAAKAARYGVRLVGPDSEGVFTPFFGGHPDGNTALMSEGGAVLSHVAAEARRRAVPFRYAFSLGENSDYSPFEAAKTILEVDDEVDFFVFIVDLIKKGRELLDFAAAASRLGKKTAILQVMSYRGRDRVEDAALKQYGITSFSEPFQVIDGAAAFYSLRGKKADSVVLSGGTAEMKRMLAREAEISGLRTAEQDDGSCIVVHALSAPLESSSFGRKIRSVTKKGHPLIAALAGGANDMERRAASKGITFIPGIRRCMEALELALQRKHGEEKEGFIGPYSAPCPIHPRPTEYDVKILLGSFGIPIAKERLCRSLSEASEAAESIGFPVALKVMSPSIRHKDEARVVALNLQDREELRNAYGRTLEKARLANPKARIRGVLVQEMIRSGTEWRLQFRRDERFGPVVEMGISGVYTEILPEGVIRVAPFSEEVAMEMIRESRGYPLLLEGWRRERLDVEGFASAIAAFSRLAFCENDIARLDINPIFVNKKGVLVVDAFIEKKGRRKR